jgi:hypothetical protein
MLLEWGCDYFCAWIGTKAVGVGAQILVESFYEVHINVG